MDFRVFSRNISENMHARCVREDTKQALMVNLQADDVQSRQTLFVRYCLMHINYEILYIVLLFAVNSKKNLHDFFDSCEFL